MISTSGLNTSTWAEAVMSIQTLTAGTAKGPYLVPAWKRHDFETAVRLSLHMTLRMRDGDVRVPSTGRSCEQRVHARRAQTGRLLLDVALVPEREREQAPQLPAVVLAARDVGVDQSAHDLRPEKALPCERVCRQSLPCEGRELPAEPCRGRDREPPLAPVDDLAWQQRLGGLAQQHLLRQAAHAVLRREREREGGHDGIEERDARLERARHRRAVGLHEQVVDEVDGEVDVLEPCEGLGTFRLAVPLPIDVD